MLCHSDNWKDLSQGIYSTVAVMLFWGTVLMVFNFPIPFLQHILLVLFKNHQYTVLSFIFYNFLMLLFLLYDVEKS